MTYGARVRIYAGLMTSIPKRLSENLRPPIRVKETLSTTYTYAQTITAIRLHTADSVPLRAETNTTL